MARRARPFFVASFKFRVRGNMERISRELEIGLHSSPNSLAVRLTYCALALRYLANSVDAIDFEKRKNFMGYSPEAIGKIVNQIRTLLLASIQNYRAQGIDPQAEVTVRPHLNRIKEAVIKWQENAQRLRSLTATTP